MSRPLNILLVEDDPEDALLFRQHCPKRAQLSHVADAESALKLLHQGTVDICFTDYVLGAMSGLDLIRKARAEGARVPMVVITGQDIESLGENALLAGATDFVPKDELNAPTIERVSRWALIRRHVENRREDGLSEDMLTQLIGRAPKLLPLEVPQADTHAIALRRVVYLSQAKQAFSHAELLRLCAGFSAANARSQITGVLVMAGNCFLQEFEGEQHAVEVLLRRIQADARHSGMVLMADEPVRSRAFAQWNMGCIHLNVRYEISEVRWQDLLSKLNQSCRPGGDRRSDLSQLIRALPEVLTKLAA